MEQVNSFVINSDQSLEKKVASLFRVYGGLRVSELAALQFEDLKKR